MVESMILIIRKWIPTTVVVVACCCGCYMLMMVRAANAMATTTTTTTQKRAHNEPPRGPPSQAPVSSETEDEDTSTTADARRSGSRSNLNRDHQATHHQASTSSLEHQVNDSDVFPPEWWQSALLQLMDAMNLHYDNADDHGTQTEHRKRRKPRATVTGASQFFTDHNSQKDPLLVRNLEVKEDAPMTIRIQLSIATLLSVSVILALSFLGAVYVIKLFTRPRCSCPLCDGEYDVVKRLGTGGFGTVFKVKLAQQESSSTGARETSGGRSIEYWTSEGREGAMASSSVGKDSSVGRDKEYVLKQIPVTDFNDASIAQAEARELRALDHPRVVRYEDDFLHFTTELTGNEKQLYVCIVMESCAMDMKKLIERVRTKCPVWQSTKHKDFDSYLQHQHASSCSIPETVVLRIVGQIAEGLQYCHGKGIIHRDVKSQNAFLTAFGGIRLGDFGLARQVRSPFTVFTDAGTDCYKAPEMLLGGKRDGRAADIWALGLVIFEIVTLSFVWERQPSGIAGDVLNRGDKAVQEFLSPVSSSYSPAIRKLMRKCLASDPKNRPSPKDILRLRAVRKAMSLSAAKRPMRGASTDSQIAQAQREENSPRSSSSGSGASGETPVYNYFGWDPSRDVTKNLQFNETVRELPFDEAAADGGIFAGFGSFLDDVQYASSESSGDEDEYNESEDHGDPLSTENDNSEGGNDHQEKNEAAPREKKESLDQSVSFEEKKNGPIVVVAPHNGNNEEDSAESGWVQVQRKKGRVKK